VNSDPIVPQDNKISFKDDVPSSSIQLQQKEEITQRIPVYEEEYSITKEITKTQLHLEKKWLKSTKKIEIPINYEEMFINGREFDSYSQNELVEVISKVKEKISEVIHPEQNEADESSKSNEEIKRHYPHDVDIQYQKNEPSKENKALQFQDTRLDIDKNQVQLANNDVEDKIEEEIIPIWGEQIIIDKKMVKLGEIVIRKSKITEKRKLDVVVRKEKVTAEYPDGKKQEIL
jgi:stress response protein YsnF